MPELSTPPEEQQDLDLDLDLRRHPEEDEEWFQRLSPDFQEQARQRWREREDRFADFARRAQRFSLHTTLQALLCVWFPLALISGGVTAWLWAPLCGLLVGQAWLRFSAGQLSSGLYSGAGVACACALGSSFGNSGALPFPFVCYASLFGAALGAISGVRREMGCFELDR